MENLKPLYIATIFASALLHISFLFAQNKDIKSPSRSSLCNDSKIIFDNSAIEAIYLHPKEVLCNVDSFWTNNKAFSLTKKWHTTNNIDIPYESWKKSIQKISKLSPEERQNQIAFTNAKIIMESNLVFNEKAIPHICSFLPSSTPSIQSNIYLLTGTVPYAFAIPNDIVMDVASPNFNRDPERILNVLVHEVFHVGDAYVIIHRSEFELQDEILDYINDYLLSEGLANYVSYTAQAIYPNHKFDDYLMLENEKAVKKQLANVNSLLSKAGSVPQDKMIEMSWEIGVQKRAYYVAGAFMVKTIDEKLGRDSLINAICFGPKKVIHTYNSLVKDDMKIIEFKLPENISAYQKMRIALLQKDYQEFNIQKEELLQNKANEIDYLESRINEYAYYLMNYEKEDALELYKLNVELFPNSANAHYRLGDAYLKTDNNKLAKESFEKCLELKPDSQSVKEVLLQLSK